MVSVNIKFCFLILIYCLLLLSCSNSTKQNNSLSTDNSFKTAEQLESESLNSGVISDSLYLGFRLRMTKEEFKKHLSTLLEKKQIGLEDDSSVLSLLQTSNYQLPTTSFFFFENGILFRSINHIYPENSKKTTQEKTSIKDDILSLIEKKMGDTKYVNGTKDSDYYWLKGNKRIDYYDTLGRYIVAYSDLQIEKQIIEDIEEQKQEEIKREIERKERIFEKLKEKAQRDWPNDYSTQEYWLNEQKAAYDFMIKVPNNGIKKKAQRDWPLDFVTQKFWYIEQVEAKERIGK